MSTDSSPEANSDGAITTRPTVAPLRQRLISAGAWSLVGRAGAIGLLFATGMVLSRALSKGELAAYALATQATVFFAGVASLGTPQILSRTLRQLIYGPHASRAEEVLRNCAKILAVGCVLGTAIFLLASPLLVGEGRKWELFRDFEFGIVIWSCLAAACLNSSFALQGLDDFRAATLVGSRRGGVLPNLAFFAFSLVAWCVGAIDGHTLIIAQIVCQASTFVYARWAIRRRLDVLEARPRTGEPATNSGNLPGATARWYLAESFPFFVSMLVTLAIDELDVLWVGYLVDDAATADYAVAKQLVRFMTTPYVMFALSIAPFAAELLANDQKERLERILRAAATLVSLPMLVVFALFLLIPGPLLALANGEKFRDAAPILRMLTLGQLVFVPLGFSSQVLLMGGRQRLLMYVSGAALVGYCLLMPLATTRYGVVGAAAVQAAAFIGQAIANGLLAKRYVGVWTAATFRPADVKTAALALLRRGGSTREAAAEEAGPG
jgi:O-antigen/teichoic acid export membrane protein